MGAKPNWDKYGKCGVKYKPEKLITYEESKKIKIDSPYKRNLQYGRKYRGNKVEG